MIMKLKKKKTNAISHHRIKEEFSNKERKARKGELFLSEVMRNWNMNEQKKKNAKICPKNMGKEFERDKSEEEIWALWRRIDENVTNIK